MGTIDILRTGDLSNNNLDLLGVEEDSKTVDTLLNIRDRFLEVWNVVNNILGPSLTALWNTFQTKVLPAFQSLLPVVQMLAPWIGGLLVGAVWLLTNALNIQANVWSWLAQVIGNWAQWVIDRVHNVANVFSTVKDAAQSAFNFVRNLDWGNVFSAIGKGVGNSIIGLIEGALKGALGGLPGGIANKIKLPRFAQGGVVSSPTVGVFGEAGPEAIIPLNKPARAAQVMQQAGLAAGQTVINYNGPFYFQTAEAVREIFALQDGNSVLAAQGLSVVRP
jgi:hypothetical protein